MSKQHREELRRKREYLRKENKKWPLKLIEVPKYQWPKTEVSLRPNRVLRSSLFLCQEFEENGFTRLSFNRAAIDNEGRWMADISWEELQTLKRQAGYGNCDAVEIFPADADVINVAPMRHLWIINERIPFAWRKST